MSILQNATANIKQFLTLTGLGSQPKAGSFPVVPADDWTLPDTASGDLARINSVTISSDASLNGTGPTIGWEYSSTSATHGYGTFDYLKLGHTGMAANNYIRLPMADRDAATILASSTVDVDLTLEILIWVSGRNASFDAIPIYSQVMTQGSSVYLLPHSSHASADSDIVSVPQLMSPCAYLVIAYAVTSPTSGGLFLRVARR